MNLLCSVVGVWDQPQVIPRRDLTTKYHYTNCFTEEEAERITRVTAGLDFSDHFSEENIECVLNIHYISRKKLVKYFNEDWKEEKETIRSYIFSHEEIPKWLVKVYKGRPSAGHPMAHTLRVPMAHLVQKSITENGLDQLVVPKKGLVPLVGNKVINTLGEHLINEAFLVAAEKFNLMQKDETIETVKELVDDKQDALANQMCMIPEKIGLGDYTWFNLRLTTEKN